VQGWRQSRSENRCDRSVIYSIKGTTAWIESWGKDDNLELGFKGKIFSEKITSLL